MFTSIQVEKVAPRSVVVNPNTHTYIIYICYPSSI